eukprot:6200601-Pleurochrysis_carterae.AAC.1
MAFTWSWMLWMRNLLTHLQAPPMTKGAPHTRGIPPVSSLWHQLGFIARTHGHTYVDRTVEKPGAPLH